MDIDWQYIEKRLDELDERRLLSSGYKKKNSLLQTFVAFLGESGCPTLSACNPQKVRQFLVWKDSFGKTIVHNIQCKFLGKKGEIPCACPRRLASATVEGIIQQLVNIFDENGKGRDWDVLSNTGNPAASPLVKEYLKLIKEEQASSHVLPKQAKPIFLTKVKTICSFIDREIKKSWLTVRQKFVLYRDQAWMKLQFFAGDRASDLSIVVAQEIKVLHDGSGLVFKHTFGKTLRGDKGKSNSFVIKKCDDLDICPVKGLLEYVEFCKRCGVDLSAGYLFRVVSENGRVLDQCVSYSAIYERLRYYLSTLGIYEGETPHSFRSGCAITMALSGSVDNVDQVMNHVGWFNKSSAEYYTKMHSLVDAGIVASKLAESTKQAEKTELLFKEHADYSGLKNAF